MDARPFADRHDHAGSVLFLACINAVGVAGRVEMAN